MSTRKPPQQIIDELEKLFDLFVEEEKYTDDSKFDYEKFRLFMKERASGESYEYSYPKSYELIR